MQRPVNGGLPFRYQDFSALGFTRKTLARAVQSGVLRRPLRGVYVDTTVPDDRSHRLQCLRLVLPAGGVVWGRTAAWLYGIDSWLPTSGAC